MPPPYMPVSASPSGGWYGGASLGLTYSAQNIGRDTATGGKHFTIIPLPVAPVDELTMQARADAIASTYSGMFQLAVDLYRLTVERNGFMTGILWTMAHGFLGLPLSWKGDAEMIAALTDIRDADGKVLTPGDFARMHPENEAAKVFSDGIGLGFGLGQYLLMCCRCDGVDWLRTAGETVAHTEVETCKRCHACRTDRPIGARELYQLRWRDARWLWRNTVTGQWYYTGRQGMIPITPGDGEWLLFQTVPDQDIWIHGPWALGTEAAIFSRDSRYDLQAISATCAPTHVFKFSGTSGSDPKTRLDVDQQADNLRFQNKLTLPGEVDHRIDAAQGGDSGYVGTADRITSWAESQWEMVVTGIKEGTENGSGFADKGVLQRVSRERRRFYAGAWIRQIVTQGLKWWAADNFAGRPCPVGEYDTRSAEDKLAESKADTEEGGALKALVEGWGAAGYELAPDYLEERAQTKGVRVRPKAGGQAASKIVLGVDAVMASVLGIEARASQGLGAFPVGDPRNDMLLVELANLGKAGGAPPAPQVPPAPGAGSPPAAPGALSPPAPPAARVEADDEQRDEDDPDEDARRASLAVALDGFPACAHGRTHVCPRCGVQRVYGAPTRGADGAAVHPVAWRAVPSKRPAAPPAPMAPPSPVATT